MTTKTLSLADLTVPPPKAGRADWNTDGVLVLPGFVADRTGPYIAEWQGEHGYAGRDRDGLIVADRPEGWADATPYRRHNALRALVCDRALSAVIESLVGEPAGVHLNLTGWVTTGRDWHQDSYLNPPHVGDHYAAVWVALGDVHPDSGPFQYVPGSHRWPQVTRRKIGRHVDLEDPSWPSHSEQILSPLFEAEIERRNAQIVSYLPYAGDVLVWHGRLLHRGSKANVPGMERRALIAHYSGINHRKDMPAAVRHHPDGGHFFPIDGHQPVR